jgi:hypothetical protein
MIDPLFYNIMGITTSSAKRKWDTLEHNGIAFPPEYQPRGITITIRSENAQPRPRRDGACVGK